LKQRNLQSFRLLENILSKKEYRMVDNVYNFNPDVPFTITG
jgi:hypothetical protein